VAGLFGRINLPDEILVTVMFKARFYQIGSRPDTAPAMPFDKGALVKQKAESTLQCELCQNLTKEYENVAERYETAGTRLTETIVGKELVLRYRRK
jgi:hypothetical protein